MRICEGHRMELKEEMGKVRKASRSWLKAAVSLRNKKKKRRQRKCRRR